LGALLGLLVLVGCGGEKETPQPDVRRLLGIPHFRNPLKPVLVQRWQQRDRVFERVRFQGRYGEWIPALLVYSELARSRPLPVILCMPGSPNTKEDLLEPVDVLPRWADRGFFVLSIDRPYHGERPGNLETALRVKGLVKVWGESVYDLMRAIDYVQTRPEADASRLGMLGLSMGGMEALLLAALDERLNAVVSVAGQLSWGPIFAGTGWQRIFQGLELRHELVRSGASGERARRAFMGAYPGLEQLDVAKLTPRIAPRPLLLLVGQDDPYVPPQAAQSAYEAAQSAYAAQGHQERLALWVVPAIAHSFPPSMQERALQWFERWLNPAQGGGGR
jgi:dienelactone hydrolase